MFKKKEINKIETKKKFMGFIEKEIEGNFPNWIQKSFLFCYFF